MFFRYIINPGNVARMSCARMQCSRVSCVKTLRTLFCVIHIIGHALKVFHYIVESLLYISKFLNRMQSARSYQNIRRFYKALLAGIPPASDWSINLALPHDVALVAYIIADKIMNIFKVQVNYLQECRVSCEFVKPMLPIQSNRSGLTNSQSRCRIFVLFESETVLRCYISLGCILSLSFF